MKLSTLAFIFCSHVLSNQIHAAQAAQPQQKKATELELRMIDEAIGGTLTKDKLENYLIQGADINAKNKYGNTALMAAMYGPVNAVQALIAAHADLNVQNTQDWTALMMADKIGNMEAVRTLIAAGADQNIKDKEEKTARDWASNKDVYDHTAAYDQAVAAGEKQRADYLARKNTIPNIVSGGTMKLRTFIFISCSLLLSNQLHAAQAMQPQKKKATELELRMIDEAVKGTLTEDQLATYLQQGVDINAKNRCGDTALMGAAALYNLEVVRILTAAGANQNIINAKEMIANYVGEDNTEAYDKAVAAGQIERQAYFTAQRKAKREIEKQIFPGQTIDPGIINLISGYAYGQSPTDLHPNIVINEEEYQWYE
jgi:ankyrin repeat protein